MDIVMAGRRQRSLTGISQLCPMRDPKFNEFRTIFTTGKAQGNI